MPNHVRNKLTLHGEEEAITNLLNTIKGEDRKINFNKILPTPENIFHGPLGPDERKLYGKNNWYDWNCENWGTKWNAYDIHAENNYVEFSTAWSAPLPVIAKLALMFPDIHIEHLWADEDRYSNTGLMFYNEPGELLVQGGYFNDNSPEAVAAYKELHGDFDDE